MTPSTTVLDRVAAACTEHRLGAVAAAARVCGDLDLAQDAASDAVEAAVRQWPVEGFPQNPGGWLATAARRRAVDALRRRDTLRRKLPLLVADTRDDPVGQPDPDDTHDATHDLADDTLRLVFTCCHPALPFSSQVPLALRLLCGLSTEDVADVLLAKPATVAARITRAKRKLTAAGVPYRVPGPAELPARLRAVLDVVAAVHTVGHTDPRGAAVDRPDATALAERLCRALLALLPDDPEVAGLTAVVVLARARRAGRSADDGDLVLLRDADRTRWDRDAVTEGLALAARALAGPLGPYALQAGIAGLHTGARSWEETDWPRVLQFHDALLAATPGPAVALNRELARLERPGASRADHLASAATLAALAHDPALRAYPYLPAAQARVATLLGDHDGATAHYDRAITLAGNAQHRALLRRLRLQVDARDAPAG